MPELLGCERQTQTGVRDRRQRDKALWTLLKDRLYYAARRNFGREYSCVKEGGPTTGQDRREGYASLPLPLRDSKRHPRRELERAILKAAFDRSANLGTSSLPSRIASLSNQKEE